MNQKIQQTLSRVYCILCLERLGSILEAGYVVYKRTDTQEIKFHMLGIIDRLKVFMFNGILGFSFDK